MNLPVSSAKKLYQPVQYLKVDYECIGQRLDNFLFARLKKIPRSYLYRILRTGQVRVNQGRKRAHYRLQEGDVIRIPPMHMQATKPPAQDRIEWLEKHILYEDDILIALNKPSGIAVHGGSGVQLGIIEAMRTLRPTLKHLELVHRLDRDTSGCLLLAKRRSALRSLHEQLRQHEMVKIYQALVKGVWEGKGSKRVQAALKKNQLQSGERRVTLNAQGKDAVSDFSLIRSFVDASLVRIHLHTGRTHQARVHAAHVGCPIAGDTKYGDTEFNSRLKVKGLKRLFLHAAELTFKHPKKDVQITVAAPLPNDLRDILERLDG